ncbi:MATE family efflux transporter [Clostridium sp. chh4-2]|uniref:MATE family efflux transporter n=1 Tax=Clostridium sp. chh4-2 TaxID=2067550 RepID=UPI000CCE8F54|nr:MATE family efflux transporter [Clostridium sp. chh4-2]PNV61502.1 MATE family efflux transporter [Clostridium sp. chh4-2]
MEATIKKKQVGRNLTEGPIFSTLLLFAVPIIITNLIQQLYGMVDLIVIGQFVGSTGTVGVSTGGEIADLITPVAMGFSTAGQIFIAQLAGAREEQRIKDTVGTLLTFMLICSAALVVLAILFCKPILRLLNCPQEAVTQAEAYLIITAFGFPFIFGYNAVVGILRGMGESKRPLLFVSVAAVVNIVLDVILVAVFDMQAAGTAIATTFSQFGSFLAAFIYLWKRREKFDFELKRSYFTMKKDILLILIKLGIPQVVRSLLVRFSLLWINSNVNAYGLAVSATNSVGNKIQKFAEVFNQGVDTASAAMIGQNLGAKKPERARKTTWSTLSLTMMSATVACSLCLLIPQHIYGMFTADEAVISLGVIYLHIMMIQFFASAFIGPFQAMVTGCGFVSLGFAIGILDGVVCKIGLSLLFVHVMNMGYVGYFWGISCSRILPGLLCFSYFMSGKWKTRRLLSER